MFYCVISFLAFAVPILAAAGDGDWASAYAKATAALAKLTMANKITMVTGVGWEKGPCVGNIAAIAAINFPELCLQDGPLGYVIQNGNNGGSIANLKSIRYAQQVTAFPAGITTGSTWDTELMYARGFALGKYFH
jgi:beta-glucosidase